MAQDGITGFDKLKNVEGIIVVRNPDSFEAIASYPLAISYEPNVSSSNTSGSSSPASTESAQSGATTLGTIPKTQNKDSVASSTQTTSGAGAVADYCDKMQGLHSTLVECMDATHDAEAVGDVAAAQEAKKRSDDAYGEVLRSKAPAEAKDVDTKMRAAAASMNLLAAFYEDATIAKAEGDKARYQEDMAEIKTVINDVDRDSKALSKALADLTAKYQ